MRESSQGLEKIFKLLISKVKPQSRERGGGERERYGGCKNFQYKFKGTKQKLLFR